MMKFKLRVRRKKGRLSQLVNYFNNRNRKRHDQLIAVLQEGSYQGLRAAGDAAPVWTGKLRSYLYEQATVARNQTPTRRINQKSVNISFFVSWDFPNTSGGKRHPSTYVYPQSEGFGPSGGWAEKPPVRELARWAREKLGADTRTARKIARSLAAKIRAVGIEPKEFLDKGFEVFINFVRTNAAKGILLDITATGANYRYGE